MRCKPSNQSIVRNWVRDFNDWRNKPMGGFARTRACRTDILRVQVCVPQADYFGFEDGELATVTVPEYLARYFMAR